MSLSQKIKMKIIKKAIDKRKGQHPFDEIAAENYTLPPDADANQNNSFYFSGHALDGKSLLFRNAYRGGGRTELWFAARDSSGNAWVNPKDIFDNYEPDGLTIKCVEPTKIWEFEFAGQLAKMRLDERLTAVPTGELCDAVMKGRFTATAPIFEFSRHFDSLPVARALSREKLKKGFTGSLAENHQVHYEQSGIMEGQLTIDGKTMDFKLPAIRDHSYGKRDWDFMNRHVWIISLLEDGSDLNFNAVSYPILRELQTGYLIKGDERVSTNYYDGMSQYEKTNDVPLEITNTVVLMDGRKMTVKGKKQLEFRFNFGTYEFHEGIAEFDINGKKARGIIEFGFNVDKTRWENI